MMAELGGDAWMESYHGRDVKCTREGKVKTLNGQCLLSHRQTGHNTGLDRGKTAAPGGTFIFTSASFFLSYILFIYLFLNILFHTGVELIYNVGLVSSVQQTDSATKNSHTLVFTVVLFTIVKTWKQCRRPSTEEWIKKIWYLYTMEYYSAIIKNGIIPFGAMWMDQVIITK